MLGATVSILLVYLVVMICVWVLPGVYVYRDAKDRGMQAVLWTLIAVVTPGMIGFIIYLVVRGNYSNLRCPACGERVKEQYVVCPGCGRKLRSLCPSCSAPVESGWKVCPWCAAPLPEKFTDVTEPVRQRDRGLGKILAAVILIPLLLLVVLLLNFAGGGSYAENRGSSSMFEVSREDYLRECRDPQVEDWLLAAGSEYDSAYVLKYQEEENGQEYTQYLIYLPWLSEDAGKSVGASSGILGRTLRVELSDSKKSGGDTLLFVESRGTSAAKLKLYCNGKKLPLVVTGADVRLKAPGD